MSLHAPLIAVDVGNSRIKLGWFDAFEDIPLPTPAKTLELDGTWNAEQVTAWLPASASQACWLVSSVAPSRCEAMLASLRQLLGAAAPVRLLSPCDAPLKVAIAAPDQVGLDRLMGAVAANRLRRPGVAAIIVDSGTAITVNRLEASGAFAGGAILPGLRLAARALSEGAQLLPPMPPLTAEPPVLGVDTISAMQAGVYWGAVGAISVLVGRLSFGADYDLFLTGGGAELLYAPLSKAVGANVKLIPQLTLSGIAICASSLQSLTRAGTDL